AQGRSTVREKMVLGPLGLIGTLADGQRWSDKYGTYEMEKPMNDWSTHILSARKAVANLEAALTLRRFDLARHELILAKVALGEISGWLDEQEDRTMQLGLD